MRWDHLFDDLEGQLERELTAEEQDLGIEEERLRLGRLSVRDRVAALHEAGHPIGLTLTTGERLVADVDTLGRDWFSATVAEGAVRSARCLVPLASIASLVLAPGQVEPSLVPVRDARAEASLSMRLGLPFVLRDLCRRRWALDLVVGATTLHGTIDRVGRDHLDLAMHEPGSARRNTAVREVRVVPLKEIVLVSY